MANKSITYWNRIEPRPRSPSIALSLAAQVRDPAWLLARQWQLGEFLGEDAASPAYIELSASLGRLVSWSPDGGAVHPMVVDGPPLEELVETEPFTPDLSLRVELGQVFEALLDQAGAPELADNFREVYRLPLILDPRLDHLFDLTDDLQPGLDQGAAPPGALVHAFQAHGMRLSPGSLVWVKEKGVEWVLSDDQTGQSYAVLKQPATYQVYLLRDSVALGFLRVCAGRAIDGVALLQAYQDKATFALPSGLTTDQETKVKEALSTFENDVKGLFGAIGADDAPAWKPSRLEYSVDMWGDRPGDRRRLRFRNRLSAQPGRDGEFDWHDFDLLEDGILQPRSVSHLVHTHTLNVLPMNVQFKGMPNARWWEFESSATDFGDVRPDKRDLAKLILMDFMLVHGNDWFVIPFDQPVGTMCWIDTLLVHDVFGDLTLVKRADKLNASTKAGERWTMFSTTRKDDPATLADFLILPPSAAMVVQNGPDIEEIRLLRDEMANMVWAIEHSTENGIGRPWLGVERDQAGKPALPPVEAETNGSPPEADQPSLRYLLHTGVPVNWIPFIPINIDPEAGKYALELGTLPDDHGRLVLPAGRILQPTNQPGGAAYRIQDEEVNRAGTIVQRVVCRTRWVDGATYLWIARRKRAGTGEGASGLRFDLALPNQ